MLRQCRRGLSTATSTAITDAARNLNKLLDIVDRRYPARHDEVKRLLKAEVMPVLSASKLDHRGNAWDLRHTLGQLTRDAAFAAVVIRARPESAYMQTLTTCIKEDHRRMRFLTKMTSPQASKIIEFLCKAGVRDPEVFPVLLSRINFAEVHQVARAAFALAEAKLHSMNMLVLVPLYSGEVWTIESGARSETTARPSCNAFDAVRILRALSKSCRAFVEGARHAEPGSEAQVPGESLNLLRNNLLRFIFDNAAVMRGAHWLNIARALLNFPEEFRELRHLSSAHEVIRSEVRAALNTPGDSAATECALNCDTVAAAAMRRLFQYADGVAALPAPPVDGESSLSPELPFDLKHADMVKLLPLLDQLPRLTPASQTQQRVDKVLHVMCANVQRLSLDSLVTALQALRRARPTERTAAAVGVFATEAGNRLTATTPAEALEGTSFRTVVLLAAALAALRVTRCDGFVTLMAGGSEHFPSHLTVDTSLSLINALASLTMTRTSACHQSLETILARMLSTYRHQLQHAPLVDTAPIQVARLLRGCVLLDYIPTTETLRSLLGYSELPPQVSADVHRAGGSLVFDLSRSISHFVKQARATAPERETVLWEVGVLASTLPLAVVCTQDAANALERYTEVVPPSHTAVLWRTTIEMLAHFVDSQADNAASRLLEALPETEKMLRAAAVATRAYLKRCSAQAHRAKDVRQRVWQTPFHANCIVHYLSAILIFEYTIFSAKVPATHPPTSGAADETGETPVDLRERYRHFLDAAISETCSETPMDVVRSIFAYPLACTDAGSPPAAATAAAAAAAATEAATTPPAVALLHKRDAVEITTALPFAVSLVLDPGPVNEFFTERCMSIMVDDGADVA
ncbi:hypothetical protein NESM_000243300 [Novymonas esmeraldas]|uniref:Uncharacterized protein n=1 Tax=Novymonas esmeraldas TaxID=1808958 RepID=A0AAW0F7X2_9TRYP